MDFLEQLYGVIPATGACPHCGQTEEAFQESGFLGCPLCYSALQRQIRSEIDALNVSSTGER